MSAKEIKESREKGKAFFGIKQILKNPKKVKNVFVAKDARNETIKKLEGAKIDYKLTKTKKELSKELNLDFESEVFSIF